MACGMPLQQKKILKSAGNCVYSFAHFDKTKTILIYIFSFVLITLVSLKLFSLFAKIVLELCAIIGLYISIRESNFAKISGVYDKGIICSEGFFLFDDILTLPILNLPKKEQENYSKNSLVLATKSKGKVEIILDDESQCENVKKELFTICARLKP